MESVTDGKAAIDCAYADKTIKITAKPVEKKETPKIGAPTGQKTIEVLRSQEDRVVLAKLERVMPPPPPPALIDSPQPKHLDFTFKGDNFSDVIDVMRDESETNIVVNWKSLASIGIKEDTAVTVSLRDPTLKEALAQTLQYIKTAKGTAHYIVEDGAIKVFAAQTKKSAPPAVSAPAIPEAMDRVIPEVFFDGQELTDIFQFMQDVTGLKINPDWDRLQPVGIKKESPVKLRLKNLKTSSVLKIILESVSDGKNTVQCTFQQGVVSVSAASREQAAEKSKK
jgi:hypothetical protein